MYKHIKFHLILVIFLTWTVFVAADTKVLQNVVVNFKRTLRDETISLDNDDNLLVEGIFVQKYSLPDDPDHILKFNTDYIADKDGYRTKYTLVREEYLDPNRLATGSLKSLAG